MSDDEEMDEEMVEMLELQAMQSGFNRELGLDDVEIPVPLSNCHLLCYKVEDPLSCCQYLSRNVLQS